MDEYISIALLLMTEKVKGTQSRWKPYFDVLPDMQAVYPSFIWNDEELEMLKGSPIYYASLSLRYVISLLLLILSLLILLLLLILSFFFLCNLTSFLITKKIIYFFSNNLFIILKEKNYKQNLKVYNQLRFVVLQIVYPLHN